MAMDELVPEIHDIGKLVDSSIVKHNFEDYPRKLKGVPEIKMNPVWEGILQHHSAKDFDEYPRSFQTFVLSIADSVASATSRHIEVKGETPRYNIYKLWNPPLNNIHELSKVIDEDATDTKWVAKIIEFVNKNPSAKEFFETFERYLRNRTEDAYPGSNVTSLWTHSRLTALFYNFLHDYFEKVDDGWFRVTAKDDIRDYIHKIRKMPIKVTRVKINFSQTPVRIRDLNVFDVLAEIKEYILRKYPNNVIFVRFDELLLILPLDESFEEMKKIVSKYGFWLETVERIQNLDQPYPDPDRIVRLIKKMQKVQQRKFGEQIKKVPPNKRKVAEGGIRKTIFEKGKEAKRINELGEKYYLELKEKIYKKDSIYSYLPPNIDPPICELCQMNQATESWEDKESGITEELCINCLNVRKRGAKFPKLDKWEKERADRILWIKIDLDTDELISVLEDLYAEYLRNLDIRNPEERAEIRFSVLSEFDWDYEEFLDKFGKELSGRFGEDNFQQILDEFISINIETLRDIQTVLKYYDELFTESFPKFKKTASPIKLGVVCTNIKYPFLECWRILSNLEDEVHVSLIGKGKIKLQLSQLTPFLTVNVRNKALLHKLTALSEVSYKLAEITLFDKADGDYKRYKPLRKAAERFGFQNILSYAKILGG